MASCTFGTDLAARRSHAYRTYSSTLRLLAEAILDLVRLEVSHGVLATS